MKRCSRRLHAGPEELEDRAGATSIGCQSGREHVVDASSLEDPVAVATTAADVGLGTGFTNRGAPDNSVQFDDPENMTNCGAVRMSRVTTSGLWTAATQGLLPRLPIPSVSFALDWAHGDGSPRKFIQTNVAPCTWSRRSCSSPSCA